METGHRSPEPLIHWLKRWLESYVPLLQRAGYLYREHWRLLLPATAVCVAFSAISLGFLFGPLAVGLYRMLFRILKESAPLPEVRDIWRGFDDYPESLMFTITWGGLMAIIYALLLAVPFFGWALAWCFFLVFHAALFFGLAFIADRRVSFLPASQLSFEILKPAPLSIFTFSFAAFILGFSGVIILYVGVFLTAPYYFAAVAVAYHDLLTPES